MGMGFLILILLIFGLIIFSRSHSASSATRGLVQAAVQPRNHAAPIAQGRASVRPN